MMVSRSACLRGAAVVMLLLSVAATAHAEPTAAERETARQLMERGRDRLEEKNYKAALEAFKAADELMKVPSTGFQVGNAQVQLGLLVEARDTFGRVARSPQPPDESVPFRRAREACAHLYIELEGRIPSVTFDVRRAPGPVTIVVDDITVSPAVHKFPFKLNPGRHVVVAKSGASVARVEVDVAEKETKEVVLNMPAAPAAATGPVVAPAERPGPSTLTYVGFGVAGLGVVVGSVTGILMFSNKSSLDDECTPDKQCPKDGSLSSAYTMATISTISFAVAAVGAGVGVYGLLTRANQRSAAASGVNIEAWAGVGTGGLRGSF